MAYIKTKGIVLKEVTTGEADKIITILSQEYGKISIYAKGARRPKSRFIACTQVLCYSEFLLFKGKDLYNINTCDVLESFSNASNDLIKLTYAAHLIDVIYDTAQEDQNSSRELRLLLNTLHFLFNSNKRPELVTSLFEIRYLCNMGYSPNVNVCDNCYKEVTENIRFSFKRCGFLCSDEKCLEQDYSAIRILPGTAQALRYIVYAKTEKLFSFDVSDEVLKQLNFISGKYLRERLDKNYSRLDYLKNLDL